MVLGIFARTFARPTLEAVLDAVRAHGLTSLQFNLACAGLPTVPETISPDLCDRVSQAMAERGLRMAAISGTINLIHPDEAQRAEGVRRLSRLIHASPGLGTRVVTLCTGSRDPDNMWRRHPDNDTPEAWADLLASLATLLPAAEAAGVTLGVEPEPANVINTAAQARRLLNEIGSPALKVVFDGANLLAGTEPSQASTILKEAAQLLGDDVVLAHAKNLNADGREVPTADPAGRLNYDEYLAALRAVDFDGPLILHGLPEEAVPESISFLRRKLASTG